MRRRLGELARRIRVAVTQRRRSLRAWPRAQDRRAARRRAPGARSQSRRGHDPARARHGSRSPREPPRPRRKDRPPRRDSPRGCGAGRRALVLSAPDRTAGSVSANDRDRSLRLTARVFDLREVERRNLLRSRVFPSERCSLRSCSNMRAAVSRSPRNWLKRARASSNVRRRSAESPRDRFGFALAPVPHRRADEERPPRSHTSSAP